MVDIIPPLNSLPPESLPGDKIVVGEISALPPTAPSFKPGDNMLLNFLLENDALSFKASLQINKDGEGSEIPLTLKLDQNLRLPVGEKLPVLARVVKNEDGVLSFRLTNINNQKPSAFLAPAAAGEAKPSLPPLLIQTNESFKALSLSPLPLAKALDSLAAAVKLPLPVRKALSAQWQDWQLPISPKAVVSATIPADNPSLPGQIKQLMNDFAASPLAENASPAAVRGLAVQIHEALQSLGGQTLLADFPEETVPLLQTSLGKTVAEVPVKLPPGQRLLLEISPLPELKPMAEMPLEGLLNSERLLQQLKPLSSLFEAVLKPAEHNISSADASLWKQLTAPLPAAENTTLLGHLASKIPAPGPDMLLNLHQFAKAAASDDLSAWLGKELLQELGQKGSSGQEVLLRLSDFLTTAHREGPTWRVIEIPFFGGEGLSKIRLAVKKNDGEDERRPGRNKGKGGTRFIVDTSFSRLGKFQFDGFSVPVERRFDLIVRTGKELGEDLAANIFRLFKQTLHDVDFVGTINLNVKEKFIKVVEDEKNECLAEGIYI